MRSSCCCYGPVYTTSFRLQTRLLKTSNPGRMRLSYCMVQEGGLARSSEPAHTATQCTACEVKVCSFSFSTWSQIKFIYTSRTHSEAFVFVFFVFFSFFRCIYSVVSRFLELFFTVFTQSSLIGHHTYMYISLLTEQLSFLSAYQHNKICTVKLSKTHLLRYKTTNRSFWTG